jgi:hypothetical protein
MVLERLHRFHDTNDVIDVVTSALEKLGFDQTSIEEAVNGAIVETNNKIMEQVHAAEAAYGQNMSYIIGTGALFLGVLGVATVYDWYKSWSNKPKRIVRLP